jgi:hypothetical protein
LPRNVVPMPALMARACRRERAMRHGLRGTPAQTRTDVWGLGRGLRAREFWSACDDSASRPMIRQHAAAAIVPPLMGSMELLLRQACSRFPLVPGFPYYKLHTP